MNPAATEDCGAADRLLDHVEGGDTGAAHAFVTELLSSGWTPEAVVTDVLTVVQRRVGEKWQAGTFTTASEHAATAVVDDILGALGQQVPAVRPKGTIALTCAEGEWHVTPARMAALLFRLHGWRTTFFGGSTPVEHLERNLASLRPDVVAISCTYPLFLSGAARVAELASRLQRPSLAGGRAFGDGPARAHNLGVDGWAPDVVAADQMLFRWLDDPPGSRPPADHRAVDPRLLERHWVSIADQGIQRLANVVPPVLPHRAHAIDHVRRDLVELLHVAYIADRCHDPSVFAEFVHWLQNVNPPRGLPHEAIEPSIRILHDLTRHLDDRAQAILRYRARGA